MDMSEFYGQRDCMTISKLFLMKEAHAKRSNSDKKKSMEVNPMLFSLINESNDWTYPDSITTFFTLPTSLATIARGSTKHTLFDKYHWAQNLKI